MNPFIDYALILGIFFFFFSCPSYKKMIDIFWLLKWNKQRSKSGFFLNCHNLNSSSAENPASPAEKNESR